MAASKVAVLLLIGCAALLLGGAEARMAIACSPYVYPCNCGLCPNIVNCETKQSAECFCGRNSTTPGVYPHPTDKTKYWMCSYDAKRKIAYGVEATCPYQLLWDAVLKVCTFPDVVSQQQQLQERPAADAKAPATPTAAAGPTTPAATTPASATTDKPASASSGSSDKPAAKTIPAATSPTTTTTTAPTTTAPTTTAPTTSGKPDVTVAAADAAKALPASTKVAADIRPAHYQAYKPRMP